MYQIIHLTIIIKRKQHRSKLFDGEEADKELCLIDKENILAVDNPGTASNTILEKSIRNKTSKSSKTRQNQKTLISAFA